jgi:hypothetical protein
MIQQGLKQEQRGEVENEASNFSLLIRPVTMLDGFQENSILPERAKTSVVVYR